MRSCEDWDLNPGGLLHMHLNYSVTPSMDCSTIYTLKRPLICFSNPPYPEIKKPHRGNPPHLFCIYVHCPTVCIIL